MSGVQATIRAFSEGRRWKEVVCLRTKFGTIGSTPFVLPIVTDLLGQSSLLLRSLVSQRGSEAYQMSL